MPRKIFFPYVLITLELAIYLSMDMYAPCLPFFSNDFNVSHDLAQYTVTSWFFGAVSLQLIIGPLSDRFGRRAILIFGTVLFAISSYICAVTLNFEIFMMARFLQGCTCAVPVVVGYAAVHESFDDKSAMKILAIMGSITVLAPALGPLIGSVVIFYSHWRIIFWILTIMGLCSLLAMYFFMPETIKERHPLELKKILTGFLGIIRNKRFLGFVLPISFAISGFVLWMIESPFIIIEEYGGTVITYGVMQLFIFGIYILCLKTMSKVFEKNNPLIVLMRGYLVALIGSIGLVVVAYFMERNLYLLTMCMMVCSTGMAACYFPSNRLAISSCTQPMGLRTAMFSVIMNAVLITATILMSFVNNNTMFNLAMVIFVCTLLAFVTSFLVFRSERA